MYGIELLVPYVGELLGGGLREYKLDNFSEKYKSSESLNWYFELRKWGAAPSGGFGIGFERLLLFLLGTPNVKDVIPFPCNSKHSVL